MSFDDVVMSNMLAGARQSTLPVLILSMNKSGITPDVNALTTIMVLVIVTAMILNNIIQNSLKKKKSKI
ncbi:MAG: spermidine/putrescine ABC transporter permease PotC, partial [Anaerotignum sp.]|nr:spermidine/putrescine ABC transporter permease PotC [Anaerotignum sp.]